MFGPLTPKLKTFPDDGAYGIGGRLSLNPDADVSTSTTNNALYYMACVDDRVDLWDGGCWRPTQFDDGGNTFVSINGSVSTTVYDVFARRAGGKVKLETLAWTSGILRATALARKNGRWVLSTDPRLLLLGSYRASAANTTSDSASKRFLCNAWNVRPRPLRLDFGGSWSYALTTWRQLNATATNQVEWVQCLPGWPVDLTIELYVALGGIGIGVDSITVPTVYNQAYAEGAVRYDDSPGIGYHYGAGMEMSPGGALTFFGQSTAQGIQSKLVGHVWG